jgi:hypothetical protein
MITLIALSRLITMKTNYESYEKYRFNDVLHRRACDFYVTG